MQFITADMIALVMICNFHSVCLFQHGNYDGDYLCSGVGTVEYSEINALGLNDAFSSAVVPSGLRVTVYQHANNGGDSQVFTENTPRFGASDVDFNDIVSSFVVELD